MTNDLTREQTERLAALDCVLHYFRGQAADELPDTVDLLAMAEWVIDGTAELALRAVDADVRRSHELDNRAQPGHVWWLDEAASWKAKP